MNSKKWLLAAGASSVLALGVAAVRRQRLQRQHHQQQQRRRQAVSGEIAGAGSSAQEAAQEAWIAGRAGDEPGCSRSRTTRSGSGGGREQFIAGGVDYAGTDSSFADEELTGAEKRCGGAENFVQVPAYISPIAVIYNLPGVDSAAARRPRRSPEIFTQKITNWNDPAIAADNPDAKLPDQRITPVNRSDDSGTTANFTDYLSAGGARRLDLPARRHLARQGRRGRRGHLGRRRGGQARRRHDRLRR